MISPESVEPEPPASFYSRTTRPEWPGPPRRFPQKEGESGDVREVMNYVKRLHQLPVSLRLLRELHARLMKGVRGQRLIPGEFRRTQNFIGPGGCTLEDATYVPPPVPQMHEALDRFERYLHHA